MRSSTSTVCAMSPVSLRRARNGSRLLSRDITLHFGPALSLVGKECYGLLRLTAVSVLRLLILVLLLRLHAQRMSTWIVIAKYIAPRRGDHRLLLFYDVLFADESPCCAAPIVMLDGRKFAMLTRPAVLSSHGCRGCGFCNQKEEGKEGGVRFLLLRICRVNIEECRVGGSGGRDVISRHGPTFCPREGKRCDARVLLDALPILPATQSKVSPMGPS